MSAAVVPRRRAPSVVIDVEPPLLADALARVLAASGATVALVTGSGESIGHDIAVVSAGSPRDHGAGVVVRVSPPGVTPAAGVLDLVHLGELLAIVDAWEPTGV